MIRWLMVRHPWTSSYALMVTVVFIAMFAARG